MMRQKSVCAVLSVLLCASVATAAWTTDDKGNFLAMVGAVAMESFEEIEPSGGAETFPSFPAADLGNHFDVDTSEQFLQIWNDPPHATHGDQLLFWYAAPALTPAAHVNFSNFFAANEPINSFGLHVIDWASAEASGTLSITTDAGHEFTIAVSPPYPPEWNTLFFGFVVDEPFTAVALATTADDGWVLVDEVYLPEPTSLGLLGLGGLAVLRRRRRTASK